MKSIKRSDKSTTLAIYIENINWAAAIQVAIAIKARRAFSLMTVVQ